MAPTHRHIFILGLWLQPDRRPGQSPAWRIVLEDALTAERSGFKTLAELEAFLATWMAKEAETDSE
jgi:hypothetical protein